MELVQTATLGKEVLISPGTTYLIQVLLFLLHCKLAPLRPLFPPLSLFLSFFFLRDPKSPLATRSGLQREERECEKGLSQPLKCRKVPPDLKELFQLACFSVPPGLSPPTLLSMQQPPDSCAHKELCSKLL